MPQKLRRLPLAKGAPRKLPPLTRQTTDTSQADHESDDQQQPEPQISQSHRSRRQQPEPQQPQRLDMDGVDDADMKMIIEADLLGGCGLPDDDFDDDDAD